MSTRLRELRERQAQVVTEARERLDQINANTDESRAAELETAHDNAMAEYDRLQGQIDREERQARIDANAQEQRERRRPIPGDSESRSDPDPEAIQYRHVFAKIVCGVSPAELDAEERAVLKQGATKFEQRTQTAGTAAAGGYTVPTELMAQIERAMKAWGPMFDDDFCTVINTTSGNELTLPTIDDTAVEPEPHVEGAALVDDGGKDVTFGKKSLNAYSFDTEFIKWSWELDLDSIVAMEALLGDLLGERLARLGNKQLTIGTGADAPNGVVTASGLGFTTAATNAIVFDELIELEHSIDPAYRGNPKVGYQFNDGTLKAVRKLKNSQGDYIWQAGDVQKGVPATLNGYRYRINQAMAAIAAGAKPITFGDMSKYYVRKVGAPVIGVLRERFWPQIGIAGLIRFDGELAQPAAVKHLLIKAA